MERDEETVEVTIRKKALAGPNFVVEEGGRFYVAVALLEYDPKARNITEEQKRGVKQMQQMFEKAHKGRGLRAAQLQSDWTLIGPVNTGPVNTKPVHPDPANPEKRSK